MKGKLLALLLALSLAVLSGCGGAASSGGTAEGEKHLVWGDTTFNGENGESDIHPHHDNGGWACIRYGVGETLFRFSGEMEIQPWLAEDYERVDDLTWIITLRENVTFTSGRQMDAQAVKECLEALVASHPRAAGDLRLEEVRAEGQTLTLVTQEPVPALLHFLADPYGCIIDMEAEAAQEGLVSGTGPYQAVSLTPDTSLELVKHEQYWNGTPKLDAITVRTISDGDTLTMALQSGEIDVAYGMPYASYPLFENASYTFTSCATSRAFFGTMNLQSQITGDPAVRQAIAMGIDKEEFVTALLDGNGYSAAGVYPDSFSFGGDAVAAQGYDPEGAQEILEAAGWVDSDGDGIREKEGVPLTLRWLTYPSRQELPLLAEYAQAALGALGFDVQVINTADHAHVRADPAAWDLYVSAMVTAPTGDPEYFFAYRCLDRSGGNDGGYHSDRLEELALELSRTFDRDRRGELAVEMQQVILEDNAYVFFSHLRMSMISRSAVTGLTAHPCDYYEITAELDLTA